MYRVTFKTFEAAKAALVPCYTITGMTAVHRENELFIHLSNLSEQQIEQIKALTGFVFIQAW